MKESFHYIAAFIIVGTFMQTAGCRGRKSQHQPEFHTLTSAITYVPSEHEPDRTPVAAASNPPKRRVGPRPESVGRTSEKKRYFA